MPRFFSKNKKDAGFTITEIVVVMVIVSMIFGLVVINLIGAQSKKSIETEIDTVISDIKSQQSKAMFGTKENNSPNSYGIYFEQSKYTMFSGTSYSASNPSNFVINLKQNLIIQNITFPGSVIIFSQGSGDILNFVNNSNTITVKNAVNNELKTITINIYGAIVNVN